MEWQPKAEIIHVRSAAMIKLLRSKAQSVARRPRSPLKPKSHAPNSDPLLICLRYQAIKAAANDASTSLSPASSNRMY